MAIQTLGIHHIQITVLKSVEDAAKHFYDVVLGLQEIPKPPNLIKNGGAWYRNGSSELHLAVEDVATDNHASKRHVCYQVENLKAAESSLCEAGIEIIPDQQPIEGWIRFYVRDPGGNRVEIAELMP